MPTTSNTLHMAHFLKHPVVVAILTLLITSTFGWFLVFRDTDITLRNHLNDWEGLRKVVQQNTEKLGTLDNVELRLALLEENTKSTVQNMNQSNIAMGIMQNDLSHVKASINDVQSSLKHVTETNTKMINLLTDRKGK